MRRFGASGREAKRESCCAGRMRATGMTGFRPTALLHVRGHTDAAPDRSSITRLYSPRFRNTFFLSGLLLAKLRSRAREEALSPTLPPSRFQQF